MWPLHLFLGVFTSCLGRLVNTSMFRKHLELQLLFPSTTPIKRIIKHDFHNAGICFLNQGWKVHWGLCDLYAIACFIIVSVNGCES